MGAQGTKRGSGVLKLGEGFQLVVGAETEVTVGLPPTFPVWRGTFEELLRLLEEGIRARAEIEAQKGLRYY